MNSTSRFSVLVIALVLATASAFAPATNAVRARTCATTQMNLLGRNNKGAKTHEEDIELTIAEIMKYAAKMDRDNIIDEEDEGAYVGNVISESKAEEVKSGDAPLEKIKSLGQKIKGKFKKESRSHS